MVEEKDVIFLEKFFDTRYRKVDDCNDIMIGTDKRQDAIEKAFAESNTKLNVVIAILTAIAAPIIPICIRILLGV